MVIEVVTLLSGNLVEERFHVGERTDRHAAFADFALGQGMIGVVAHQGRKVESHGEPGLALRQQVTEARVGVLRRAEAGKLAHRPKPAAKHCRVDSARVGRRAGIAQVPLRVPAGKIRRGAQTLDGITGNGRESRSAFW